MIFTTKAEYGVRLLIQLGLQGSHQPVSLKAVADAENLPLAYLERIAALLKKSFLDDRDGRDGRVACSHLSDGEHCATKLLWTRVQIGVIKSLQRTTLAELVEFASPSRPLELHG